MLNIFICDDTPVHLEIIKKSVETGILFLNVPMKICSATSSPQELLLEIEKQRIGESNIYFLDIDLDDKEYNGLNLAMKIREKDPFGLLIFVTSHIEFGLVTFEYKLGVFDYIVKTDSVEELRDKIISTLKTIEKRWETQILNNELTGKQLDKVRFISDYEERYINLNEIIAIEVIGNHRLRVITKHQIFESNGSLGKLERTLPEYFFRCHRSCLINMREIMKKEKVYEKITMSNGFTAYCAKRRQKDFLKILDKLNS